MFLAGGGRQRWSALKGGKGPLGKGAPSRSRKPWPQMGFRNPHVPSLQGLSRAEPRATARALLLLLQTFEIKLIIENFFFHASSHLIVFNGR